MKGTDTESYIFLLNCECREFVWPKQNIYINIYKYIYIYIYKWRCEQDGFVAFVSGGRWIK